MCSSDLSPVDAGFPLSLPEAKTKDKSSSLLWIVCAVLPVAALVRGAVPDLPAPALRCISQAAGGAMGMSWIGNVVSFWLWTSLLGRYAANRVAPFSFGVPVLGILAGTLILHETVTLWQWIGGALVMLALLVVVRGGMSARRQ